MGDNSVDEREMALKAASVVDCVPGDDSTPSSIESTPEPDTGPEPSQEPAPPQKRKGGRKPIYATSEERKQRNRQAQAAFRERRTEYIKQLEATIKTNEDSLGALQQQHRQAADECLMLRYKNSLLERILLEKGIDVQAELQMKSGSPVLGPGFLHGATSVPQPPQLQRSTLQRARARRSGPNYLPKLAPGQSSSDMLFSTASPLAHPTPTSHTSSPSQLSLRSPALPHNGMTSPGSAVLPQPPGQPYHSFAGSLQHHPNHSYFHPPPHSANAPRRPHHRSTPSSGYAGSATALPNMSSNPLPLSHHPGSSNGNPPSSAATFYSSPFQKHFEQLDQDYISHQPRSAFDEPEDGSQSGTMQSPEDLHAHYPSQFDPHHDQQHGEYYPQTQPMSGGRPPITSDAAYEQQDMAPPPSHSSANDYVVDLNHMLDADPFGLSASMHFPQTYAGPQYHGQR